MADEKQSLVNGMTVVIAGPARGLALAIAQVLAENGADIAGLDIIPRDQALERISASYGVRIEYYKTDVRNGQGVKQVIKSIQEAFGSVDIKKAATSLRGRMESHTDSYSISMQLDS